jgi:uncharacterized Zn finger protein
MCLSFIDFGRSALPRLKGVAMAAPRKKTDRSTSKRFDIATLRELAGEKVFSRGIEYHEDGQVEIVSIDGPRVLAKVVGSEIYRSELRGTGKDISGMCSCPAFSDWGFCKHLVATALAANDLGPEATEQATRRLSRIRDHLRSKGIESLIEMIMKFAESDPDLLDNLQLAAAVATADDNTLFAQFKKAISSATGTNRYIDYDEAADWAAQIGTLLDQIADLMAGGRPELVLRLLDHFFTCMDEALQSVDDSDGEADAVYAKACEIHLSACRKANPDPVAVARELFARETEADRGYFSGASEAYADVLGDAGLAEYRRLATAAWQKVKPRRAGGRQVYDEEQSNHFILAAILESFAERDGDLDARIAIRKKDLTSAFSYLEIAQLCAQNGRDADAMKWAEEGLWQFEDAPDERLVLFAIELYEKAGRAADADKLLWQTFERLPSIGLYRQVKKAAGGQNAAAEAARDRALVILRAKLGKPAAKARWSTPRELLLEILMSEKLFTEAWDVVRNSGCNERQLLSLAELSEKSHPDEALSAYAQKLEQLANLGGQSNYEEACAMIARMETIRHGLGGAETHSAFLADFMRRHKAKRNLIKILQVKHDKSRQNSGPTTTRRRSASSPTSEP